MYLHEWYIFVFYFSETMRINKALFDRMLNSPSVNDNMVMMYHKLVSLIEEYNRIAKDKGLPTKNVPVYNRLINDDLLERLIYRIHKDINVIKNINVRMEKILTGVTFEGDTFDNGIWTYTILEDTTDNLNVTLNAEAFSAQFTGNNVTLDYEHMPYERLIDTEGNEYIITSYEDMFKPLPIDVKSLAIDNWTNSNVAVMNGVFTNCTSLTELTLGDNFDTTNVEDMQCMFYKCSEITKLNLGANFDTTKVTNMNAMFFRCLKLESLTLGDKFDTTEVIDMNSMFYYCSALKSLSLGNKFNTTNVTDMGSMFNGCSTLKIIDLGDKFDTSNVKVMSNMFNGCSLLSELTLGSNFDASNVTQMRDMFAGCNDLALVKLYQAANPIIKMLPTNNNWTVTDNNSGIIGTINIQQGTSANWSADPPGNWATVPLTLSCMI